MKYNERLPTVWALDARTVGFLRCRIRVSKGVVQKWELTKCTNGILICEYGEA